MGGAPVHKTPPPTSQGTLRRDPSAVDLLTLNGGSPHNVNHHVSFDTPNGPSLPNPGPEVPFVGGLVHSPRPSDKERLARSCKIGLFDIAGLASFDYHGGPQGVQELTVLFIHNCGYRSFLELVSPEDILLCFGEIQQIQRKVLVSWFNNRTQVSGPSLERILERGLKAFPLLRSMDMHDAVDFYDKFQELSHAFLIPLMPFDAVRLENNFKGLFVPGLGTERYH